MEVSSNILTDDANDIGETVMLFGYISAIVTALAKQGGVVAVDFLGISIGAVCACATSDRIRMVVVGPLTCYLWCRTAGILFKW